ncbi:MAG: transketolase [Dehalococcoidia bacterium]|nr:transketolase [Dehalococcoidia bacterium]
MTNSQAERDALCINTIRALSIDAVQAARSGHPGAPLGAAVLAYVLWERFLKHNPSNPHWPDRDRFVLSAGHASALLYSLLYLTGYDIELEDLRRFRQLDSKTPGHPERGRTAGVETSTGPLGQGFANAVGMAMAERWLAARYNRPGHAVVDHRTYCLVSDGDLEEGLSSEAASLAGTLKLGRLIALYDSNSISIEGSTSVTFTEDVAGRFTSFGWRVIGPIDGLSVQSVEQALEAARSDESRPTLIICRTIIGYGSPNKANSAASHGEPLGEEEVRLTKRQLGWAYEEPFAVPEEALASMRTAKQRGATWEREWNERFDAYGKEYAAEAAAMQREMRGELSDGWEALLATVEPETKPTATRVTAGRALNALASGIPALIGGSADLAPSTKTTISGSGDYAAPDYAGRNVRFGVREHAMASVCNGMALHGGTIPYASTFLVFYDYMRPAVRLAALMGLHVVFVFTHDSIGVGEDGPTHQPVEHILGLRSVPGLTVIRPADAAEAIEAWRAAIGHTEGPTALILTRQNVPAIDRSRGETADNLARGAYVVWEPERRPEMILIATGSEVSVAMDAAGRLWSGGVAVRVVSMPSWELFEAQPRDYRDRVLPPSVVRRMSVEAGTTLGWERYTGAQGRAIGIDCFGTSAPGAELFRRYGLTAEKVAEAALSLAKGV